MSKEISAGISISGNRAELAVFKFDEREYTLLHLQEYLRSDEHDLWFLQPLIEPHERILKKISHVSIALDTGSVFLHSYPIDSSLTQSEQNEHTNWELSRFIPEFKPNDYICDRHVLRTRAREQVAEMLVVAVQRSVIFGIQERLARKKFSVHLIDTSYFGAEHALIVEYPESKVKTVALVSVGEARVDVGIEFNGRLIEYHYATDASLESVVDVLRKVMKDSTIVEIYCCGPNASHEMSASLNETFGIPAIMLNPFRRSVKTLSFDDYEEFIGREHHFAACVGMALRRQ
jgi:Tfp pilus assembly PilM family ATPase